MFLEGGMPLAARIKLDADTALWLVLRGVFGDAIDPDLPVLVASFAQIDDVTSQTVLHGTIDTRIPVSRPTMIVPSPSHGVRYVSRLRICNASPTTCRAAVVISDGLVLVSGSHAAGTQITLRDVCMPQGYSLDFTGEESFILYDDAGRRVLPGGL
jgi:hypothetical protein